ncbi:shikimate dehydrogenase [Hoyosella sp. G463]|uniref:shikimate dehydrogenase (NADP(+)) n=1 Tax=Lolliginicoccus lacisalsi TaxID=2742202 RepID=A0A927J9R2_9ACTN|nr:shikimate dehydrogenase [Lolliginicoccus lacisalsi]
MAGEPRKAAVLGSPVGHSLSPLLHAAAYQALGLDSWTYDRIECPAGQLAGIVEALGPEWVGLSVTMPGKAEALRFATEQTDRAVMVGSANTLVRTADGWRADCTDIDGVVGALAELGLGAGSVRRAVIVGAGGTARPALAALAALGTERATVIARDAGRAAATVECGRAAGLATEWAPFEALPGLAADSDVLISTIPADAMQPHAVGAARATHVLDVIYHPWPTALAQAVMERGGRVVGGLSMLLNQAYGQVEQFTGQPAPREAMRAALDSSH